MNGMATVYPRHRDNICKCGHDIRQHVIDLSLVNNNVCNQCLTSTPTTPNRHYFSSIMENPTSGFVSIPSFLQGRPYPYYCTGSYRGIITVTTPTGSTGNILSLSSTVGIRPGMLVYPFYPNPANNTPYSILIVNVGTVALARTPNVAIPSGSTILVYGLYGSTMGPGLTANNQRGG